MTPQLRVNLHRRAVCRLCGTERPRDELTFAEHAVALGPICRADAPGLACNDVQDLRERIATALRLETKLALEADEVQYLRAVWEREGWVTG